MAEKADVWGVDGIPSNGMDVKAVAGVGTRGTAATPQRESAAERDQRPASTFFARTATGAENRSCLKRYYTAAPFARETSR